MTAADTIAAIATPAGAGGVGVVRISGPRSAEIARALTGKNPQDRIFHFSTFRDDSGAPIDRGLVVHFAQPRSFTGEDVVELHAHGSPVVLEMLLNRICRLGARRACPGEFSERAFLNGKMDLVQAEAVADLIAAGSEAAARAATRSLEGEFSRRVAALFDSLVRLRAWLEAALDFPEEEIDFLSAPQLSDELHSLVHATDELLASARRGVALRDGLHVVIVGRPNAGKSSLMNALAQSDRAIVTDIAGTTRDILREQIQLDGVAITLVDTAGLREAADDIEREGVRRAREELARADVALLVTDSANVDRDRELLLDVDASNKIFVHNKIDLSGETTRAEIDAAGQSHLFLSARTGAGLDILRNQLAALAGREENAEGSFSARARHVLALEAVAADLATATDHLQHRQGELAAEELRRAQQSLGEITGEFRSDDLLGAIFSTFCIGK